jgi:hypothetical protein
MVQLDAERLMRGFMGAISSAPYAIAPERALDLNAKVFGGEPWTLVFQNGPANFAALVGQREISCSFSALLSLWATARAAVLIGVEAMAATRAGDAELNAQPGTPVNEALALIGAAKYLIRNHEAKWPVGIPHPQAVAPEESPDWHVNNLFLGATGWVCLHEIAHLHLGHETTTLDSLLKRQEHDADEWATRWILDHTPTDLRQEFRVFAIAIGFGWLGLVDAVPQGSTTHPHAWERFGRCTGIFKNPELSPGLELAAYVLKVFFSPYDAALPSETPKDAFFETLFQILRLPR